MFKYVADISELSHHIIKNYSSRFNIAIDATLGNGYDSDFLSKNFKKVYSFDIQKEACESYADRNVPNVTVICDSHHKFKEYIKEEVDCIMYNLGFLPGGNKEITTQHNTSLKSIEEGVEILSSGGIMSICIYRGHDEGKVEETCIMEFLKKLPKSKFGVMIHSFLNRAETAPMLVIVEKK